MTNSRKRRLLQSNAREDADAKPHTTTSDNHAADKTPAAHTTGEETEQLKSKPSKKATAAKIVVFIALAGIWHYLWLDIGLTEQGINSECLSVILPRGSLDAGNQKVGVSSEVSASVTHPWIWFLPISSTSVSWMLPFGGNVLILTIFFYITLVTLLRGNFLASKAKGPPD